MRIYKSLCLGALALFLLACSREPVPGPVDCALTATLSDETPGVKTVLNPSNDEKVFWSAGEHVNVFVGDVSYEFVGQNTTAAATATFVGTVPTELGTYVMLSPYNASATKSGTTLTTTLPVAQTGYADSFAEGTLVVAGTSSTSTVTCKHVCSGLRFKAGRDDISTVVLRGRDGEKIAGNFSFSLSGSDPAAGAGSEEIIVLTAPGGGTFEADKWYYIVSLPTTFAHGIILTAYTGTQVGTLQIESNLVFSRGAFKSLTGTLNSRMSWTTLLSRVYYGPQNSFCVRPGDAVVVDVTPRLMTANWQRSGEPALGGDAPNGAQVLWSSVPATVTASLSGTNLTMSSNTAGSFLIAIKKDETILWSYLLWVTDAAPAELELPNGKKILPPLGGALYFQWGRKDPLLSSADRVANQGANGLAYSIANPTEYIKGATDTYDWYCANLSHQDPTLWGNGGSKTVWDPCPQGYRVPSEADFTHDGITLDYIEKAENNFALLGYIADDGPYTASSRTYWTRTTNSHYSTALDDVTSRHPDSIFYGQTRSVASPIRCIRE